MTLDSIARELRSAGIEEAQFEASQLVMHFTHRSFAQCMADRNEALDNGALAEAVEKRKTRYPLQYILETWDFMGGTYRVGPDCLIPRPETELLVETALKFIHKETTVLDLCTGSGCIAVSLAERTGCTVKAVDLSEGALAIAKENALSHGVQNLVAFEKEDVCCKPTSSQKYQVIVSNPPYISAEEMETLEPELSYEPRMALTDEKNGLTILGKIMDNYFPLLSENGVMILEHGAAQGPAVREMARMAGGAGETLKDLSGRERITVIKNPNYRSNKAND